jgi:hypothetical protein
MTHDELLDSLGLERIDWEDSTDRAPCPECGQRPMCLRCAERIGVDVQPAQWELLL